MNFRESSQFYFGFLFNKECIEITIVHNKPFKLENIEERIIFND